MIKASLKNSVSWIGRAVFHGCIDVMTEKNNFQLSGAEKSGALSMNKRV